MKRTARRVPVATLAALLLCAAQGGPPPVPVRVAPVVVREVHRTVELVGSALPRRKSVVAAQTEGAVERLRVEEGTPVRKGDVLAELDARILTLDIEAAAASRAEAEARHKGALESVKRSKKLFDKGRISEEEYTNDVQNEIALRNLTRRADALLRRLKTRLEKTRIRAPYDGIVTAKRVEVGEWVAEGGAALEMVDLSRVHIRLDLPERYLPRLQRQAPVTVRADSLPGETFTGKVFSVVPEADLRARTVPLKVEVENPGGRLFAGMFFRATLALDGKRKALLVPKDAVVRGKPASVVFVVKKGKVRRVPVLRLAAYGNDVEVSGELRAGEQVVVRGNERLRPNQSVRVLETPAADGNNHR